MFEDNPFLDLFTHNSSSPLGNKHWYPINKYLPSKPSFHTTTKSRPSFTKQYWTEKLLPIYLSIWSNLCNLKSFGYDCLYMAVANTCWKYWSSCSITLFLAQGEFLNYSFICRYNISILIIIINIKISKGCIRYLFLKFLITSIFVLKCNSSKIA